MTLEEKRAYLDKVIAEGEAYRQHRKERVLASLQGCERIEAQERQ